jgi:hypothetical protein
VQVIQRCRERIGVAGRHRLPPGPDAAAISLGASVCGAPGNCALLDRCRSRVA